MRIKKKFTCGTARVFVPRHRAVRKLQLSLRDFRRICILKGIYPRAPLHIKKANKGSTVNKIYYHLRDINFLANEPLIQNLRDYKVYLRKLRHAKAKREECKQLSLLSSKPTFKLDHIVKERYPTFESSLKDLDDALCLCFAFSALSRSKIVRPDMVDKCLTLTKEFMQYVIAANALRKVFVSIKGIYYQAEIMGERVTWIVGHECAVGRANELDFSVMANFVEFYVTMLSFVNYRLFKSIGLYYPPQIHSFSIKDENEFEFGPDKLDDEMRVSTLAFPLKQEFKEEGAESSIDSFADTVEQGELTGKILECQRLQTLFSGCRFFLNREVPKGSLAFVIRSAGGAVSWDGISLELYDEHSDQITHQIVDRNIQLTNINRIYLQPQWVFDSFNARCLLPTLKYTVGATLPPHLSPFAHDTIETVVKQRNVLADQILTGTTNNKNVKKSDTMTNKEKKPKSEDFANEGILAVKQSKPYKENKQKLLNQEGHDLKLREMMIKKKHRNVYGKIKYGIKRRAREAKVLEQKRNKIKNEG